MQKKKQRERVVSRESERFTRAGSKETVRERERERIG